MIKETKSVVTFVGGIFDGKRLTLSNKVDDYYVQIPSNMKSFEDSEDDSEYMKVDRYIRHSTYVFILRTLVDHVETSKNV